MQFDLRIPVVSTTVFCARPCFTQCVRQIVDVTYPHECYQCELPPHQKIVCQSLLVGVFIIYGCQVMSGRVFSQEYICWALDVLMADNAARHALATVNNENAH